MIELVEFDAARHLTDRYRGWLRDPDVARFRTSEDVSDDFWWSADWGRCIEVDGVHVGGVTAELEWRDSRADISIMVGDVVYWGREVGTAAFGMACRELSGFRKLTCGTMATNVGMVRVAEKNGFRRECVRKGWFLRDGKKVDLWCYVRDK